MRMKGFNAVGHGPVVNGVEIQYSCGKEGYQNITASYSHRRKGYAKPEHSWHSLLRVFGYLLPDKGKLIGITVLTIFMIVVNLVGAFISAPIVDSILRWAFIPCCSNPSIGTIRLMSQKRA